jgi:hypothetical protein
MRDKRIFHHDKVGTLTALHPSDSRSKDQKTNEISLRQHPVARQKQKTFCHINIIFKANTNFTKRIYGLHFS